MLVSKSKPRGLLVITTAGAASALVACHSSNALVGFIVDPGSDARSDAANPCQNQICGLVSEPQDAGAIEDAAVEDASDAAASADSGIDASDG